MEMKKRMHVILYIIFKKSQIKRKKEPIQKEEKMPNKEEKMSNCKDQRDILFSN